MESHKATEYPPTGIKIVMVGAGYEGLAAAIECHLKGHTVEVLERSKELERIGDIITISPNAGRILANWSSAHVLDRLSPICMKHKCFRIHTHTGEFIFEQPVVTPDLKKPMLSGHRADIHEIIYDYALSLGIPIHLGKRVVVYGETPPEATAGSTRKAWVECEDGERFEGDVVVAADGVRGPGRRLLGLEHEDTAKSTGYAVYRAWFNAAETGVDKDPLTRELVVDGDTHTGWLGQDMHFLAATCKGGKEMSWVCTHKDNADIEETWSFPGRIEDVLGLLKDWDPRVRALRNQILTRQTKNPPVSKTPTCIDFKLVHRAPLKHWTTPSGHSCILGDAAHPFLPTSIQGCSQAIEDAVALATVLSLSYFAPTIPTTEKIPTALKAYQRLRNERVVAAQRKGEEVSNRWHKTDWEEVRMHRPESVKIPREEWLLGHDCEAFVKGMWEAVLEEIRGGRRIEQRDLAAGYI